MTSGRKTKIFTATDRRDEGKKYLITEKDCYEAEMWALRAFCSMASADIQVPDDLRSMGAVGAIRMLMGMLEKLPFHEAKVLLDDMFLCVSFIPDPSKKDSETGEVFTRALVPSDIEEITTRLKLRKAIFSLHADFIYAAIESTLAPPVAAPMSGG